MRILLSLSLLLLACALAGWGAITYTVKAGDNLYNLGRQYGVTVAELVQANGLPDATKLSLGQQLLIPRATVYVVRPGETAEQIAQRFETTVSALAQANGLANPPQLRPGQRLIIPDAPPPPTIRVTAFTITPATLQGGWWQVSEPVSLQAEADKAVRVEFWSVPAGVKQTPALLGTDRTAADGWTLPWAFSPHTSCHVWAVAYAADGTAVASALVNVYRE